MAGSRRPWRHDDGGARQEDGFIGSIELKSGMAPTAKPAQPSEPIDSIPFSMRSRTWP